MRGLEQLPFVGHLTEHGVRHFIKFPADLSFFKLFRFRPTKLRDVITALVKQLKSTRKYRDAAHLCEMYLQDNVQSAQCLIEGLHFSEAWALTCRHSLQEFRGINLLKYLTHKLSNSLFINFFRNDTKGCLYRSYSSG